LPSSLSHKLCGVISWWVATKRSAGSNRSRDDSLHGWDGAPLRDVKRGDWTKRCLCGRKSTVAREKFLSPVGWVTKNLLCEPLGPGGLIREVLEPRLEEPPPLYRGLSKRSVFLVNNPHDICVCPIEKCVTHPLPKSQSLQRKCPWVFPPRNILPGENNT